MKVWCDSIYDSGVAKTKGSFSPVDSNKDKITIEKKDANTILGFLVNYVPTGMTDGEIVPDLVLRVSSKALGIQEQDFIIGNGTNDADAIANYVPVATTFVPFRQPSNVTDIFNADLKFQVSPSATTTEGVDVVIGVVYSDNPPDTDFKLELLTQQHGPVRGGAYAADAAKAHSSGGTAVTLTKISLPTGAQELRGIYARIIPNGITAGDPISGFMEFQASGIPDFSPQVWPLNTFFTPALGIVADPAPLSIAKGRYYPTRFPLTGAAVDISVSSTLIIAAGTAPDTIQGVIYD